MFKSNLLILILLLSSCIGQEFADPEREVAALAPPETFKGIEGYQDLTDSTVTLYWTSDKDIVGYRLYQNSVLIETIYNTNYKKLTSLDNNTLYTYQLDAFDIEGSVIETDPVIITTNEKPDTPTSLTQIAPTVSPYYDDTPTLKVFGVKKDDLVEIHLDSFCLGAVASGVAKGSTIELTTDSLPGSGGTRLFYVRAKNQSSGEFSPCAYRLTYEQKACPTGYIYVNANPSLYTEGFCVMAFEARAWIDIDGDNVVDATEVDSDGCNEIACTTENWGLDTYKPGSTYRGLPWRKLNFNSARAACRSLGEGFDIISNNEWMTIAQEIELDETNNLISNLTGGCYKSGNSGVDSVCSYSASGVTTINPNPDPDPGYYYTQLRRHSLSGNFIYDLAGNLSEWVAWYLDNGVESKTITCNQPNVELLDLACVDLGPEEYLPADPLAKGLNSINGMGKANVITSGYAIRGGNWTSKEFAGIYALNFSSSATYVPNHIGFRCVYKPL